MPEPQDRERWRAFAVCVAVSGFALLDNTKVFVAVPAIKHSLGAEPAALQLVVVGFMLTFGIFLIPAGRYGDLHSRRRLFLIGLAAFGVTSALCTFAFDPWLLVAGRLAQGAAVGILMPQVIGLIQVLFTGRERGRAFGMFGAIVGTSVALGPTLGGALVALGGPDFGWRLIWLINVPLVVIAFPLAYTLLPRRQVVSDGPRNLDLVGTALLGVTTLAVLLPFVLTSGGPADDPRRWLLLVVAGISGTAFMLWERRYLRRGRSPLIDFTLFRIRSFRNGVIITALFLAAVPPTTFASALFLQQGLLMSALLAGLVVTPLPLGSAIASLWSGRLVYRFGPQLVVIGLGVMVVGVVGAFLASMLDARQIPFVLAAAYGVTGLGLGTVASANQTRTLEDVPSGNGGLAGSIGQVAQRFGIAVGLSVATAVFLAAVAGTPGGAFAANRSGFQLSLLALLVFLVGAAVFGLADFIGGRSARPRRQREDRTP